MASKKTTSKRKSSPNRKACAICREKQNRYNREYTARKSKKLTREIENFNIFLSL